MKNLSLLINADTRPVHPSFEGMHKGVRSRDFIGRAAIEGKRKFFEGFDCEVIVHIDEHEPLTHEQYDVLHECCDVVVVRKHSKSYRGNDPFYPFNDVNYLQTFAMARCDLVAHFDQDVTAFAADGAPARWMVDEIISGKTKFISYPSKNHPHPVHAPDHLGMFWASTRFFLCHRDSIKLDVLEHAIREPQWLYENYSRPPQESPWTEQFLAVMNNYEVTYPKPDIDHWAIFPWMSYEDGLLDRMASLPYGDIASGIYRAGGEGIFHDGIDSRLTGL